MTVAAFALFLAVALAAALALGWGGPPRWRP
jgi:hypothetical protein